MIHNVHLRKPHKEQRKFIDSTAKRKVIRAGRRGGKTVGVAILASKGFLKDKRVLYAAPTADQVGRFWFEVTQAFREPIAAGVLYKNETDHVIELPGTLTRIRAKTAWNADTLRGDYSDLLILDEWQLMNEDAWELVGAPMLLDNNGDVVFIYTPPSYRTAGVSKARDKRHAAKLFKRAAADTSGRWATFHFSSHDNPKLSREALDEIAKDMTRLAYEQEILALDKEDNPGALWKRDEIEAHRVTAHPDLVRIVVALDPEATSTEGSAETGIIVSGLGVDGHGYVLEDLSRRDSPLGWARQAVTAYHKYMADRIVGEVNNGGEMIEAIIRTIDPNVSYTAVRASRGKQTRAEPVAALYEQGRMHHVGVHGELEDQLCGWSPGDKSPDRLDALVWSFTELMLETESMEGTVIYDDRVEISPY